MIHTRKPCDYARDKGRDDANELELPSEDVAIHLGHRDGGHMVRLLYGHAEEKRASDRIRQRFQDRYRPQQQEDGGAGENAGLRP